MFKPGQLIRRVKIHEDITPIVPLGGIVRVTENFQSKKVMTVVLLADYGNGWGQGVSYKISHRSIESENKGLIWSYLN